MVVSAALISMTIVNAATAGGSQIQAKLRLTSSLPNTPTGAILNLIRPDGPDGKPKTEAVGVFELPPGTTINQKAVPPCTADDTTWQIEGDSACPDSHIGNGFASLYTGFGSPVDPLGIDEQWYYAPGEIVTLYSLHGQRSPIVKIGHVKISGATFTAPLDLPPGYPPGTKSSPGTTDVTLQPYIGPNGAFITTPPSCPLNGKWITTVILHYDDGSIDNVTDATPCQKLAPTADPAARHAGRSRARHRGHKKHKVRRRHQPG